MGDKSYKEWVRDPGVYASYDDYKRGVRAVRESWAKDDLKKAARKAAKKALKKGSR